MHSDKDTFEQLVEPYRRELRLHCYRMVGSLQESEDLVQETFLRAWRGWGGFAGRSTVRTWLYTIATNACLTALSRHRRGRRVLPEALGPAAVQLPEGAPLEAISWLEPYPDSWLEEVADTAPGPERRYEQAEAVHLAFIAAIQFLPPRQRAILLLRDVVDFSARETALLLESSVASVNSALQRARATLERRVSPAHSNHHPAPTEQEQALLARYMQAWESADLDSLVSLLREDAVLNMPPWPQWYQGRLTIKEFFSWAWPQANRVGSRLVVTAANRQPAYAQYTRTSDSSEWHAHALWLLTLHDDAIGSLTAFFDLQIFRSFNLPVILPGG